jgi:hypothetical protein
MWNQVESDTQHDIVAVVPHDLIDTKGPIRLLGDIEVRTIQLAATFAGSDGLMTMSAIGCRAETWGLMRGKIC